MTKKKASTKPAQPLPPDLRIYRLKISLNDTKPLIWRRLEVYEEMEMDSLSVAIQVAFGWSGEHMAEFTIKKRTLGDGTGWVVEDPDLLEAEDQRARQLLSAWSNTPAQLEEVERLSQAIATKLQQTGVPEEQDENDIPTLGEVVPRVRTKFTYTYDFGDDWKHLIEVEKIAPAEPGIRYPRCTDGARAHPIEDCGGVWGFASLVEAVGNPKHERYGDLEEWELEKWDPAKFSVEEVNRALTSFFKLKR